MEEPIEIPGTLETTYHTTLDIYGVMYLAGFAMLCGGLWLLFGIGCALAAGGALLVATALFETLIADLMASRGC